MCDSVDSIASAVAAFRRHFADDMIHGPRQYTADELDLLKRIEGMAQPEMEAGNLAASLKTLWVAIQSGEMEKKDLADTVWLLYEHAQLVSWAASAAIGAMTLRHEARVKAEAGEGNQEQG